MAMFQGRSIVLCASLAFSVEVMAQDASKNDPELQAQGPGSSAASGEKTADAHGKAKEQATEVHKDDVSDELEALYVYERTQWMCAK